MRGRQLAREARQRAKDCVRLAKLTEYALLKTALLDLRQKYLAEATRLRRHKSRTAPAAR